MKLASILNIVERKRDRFLRLNSSIFLRLVPAYILGGIIVFFPNIWQEIGIGIFTVFLSIQIVFFVAAKSVIISEFIHEYLKYLTFFLSKTLVLSLGIVFIGIAFFNEGDIPLLLKFTIFILVSVILLSFLGKTTPLDFSRNLHFGKWSSLLVCLLGSVFVGVYSTRFVFSPLELPFPEGMGIFFGGVFFLVFSLIFTDIARVIFLKIQELLFLRGARAWQGIALVVIFIVGIGYLGIGVSQWSDSMQTRLEEMEREKILASLKKFTEGSSDAPIIPDFSEFSPELILLLEEEERIAREEEERISKEQQEIELRSKMWWKVGENSDSAAGGVSGEVLRGLVGLLINWAKRFHEFKNKSDHPIKI